jgi:hypothetical protein
MNEEFGRRFRAWLKEQELSGMAAAFRANLVVSVPLVNMWQRGKEPNPELFIKFMRAGWPDEDLAPWLELLQPEATDMRPRFAPA